MTTTAGNTQYSQAVAVDGRKYEVEYRDGVLVAAYLRYWQSRNGWCYRAVAANKLAALHAEITIRA